jgi:hypothetical protein
LLRTLGFGLAASVALVSDAPAFPISVLVARFAEVVGFLGNIFLKLGLSVSRLFHYRLVRSWQMSLLKASATDAASATLQRTAYEIENCRPNQLSIRQPKTVWW